MTPLDFPTRTVLCDTVPDHRVMLNAPRPLCGEPVDVDLRGFTVYAPTDKRLLVENFRLDAHRIIWVTVDEAADGMTRRIRDGYPDVDPAEFDRDELAAMWMQAL